MNALETLEDNGWQKRGPVMYPTGFLQFMTTSGGEEARLFDIQTGQELLCITRRATILIGEESEVKISPIGKK